jgi:hypothetical protein
MTEKTKKIEFKIVQIRNFSFSYNDHRVDNTRELESHVEVKANIGCNKDLKNVIIFIKTKFYDSSNKEKLFTNLDVGFVFLIKNFDDFYNEGKDIFQLPNNYIILFTSLSLSAIRGILFEKLRGTQYHNLLFPILNPTDVAPIDRTKSYTEVNFAAGETLKPEEILSKLD